MNRIDRVSAILIHLQTKKFVAAQELADRFEISKRTVYRDVRALEEAGIPIGSEPGKGYFLVDGFHLPPVMFTRDEASALLTAGKMVEKLTDQSVSTHFQSAMYKIKSVLPTIEKQYLEDLQSNIEVFYSLKSDFSNNYISEIQFAMAHKRLVTIDYQSISKDEETCNRIIEPVGLCFYSLGWHLIAWCQLRNDYRDFRVDRIKQLIVSDRTFQSRQKLTVKEYLFKLNTVNNNFFEICLRFDKSAARQIQTIKYYYGFIDESDHGKSIEMTFITSDLNYMSRWLMMYADAVEIVSPAELKNLMRDHISAIKNRFL
jgi:predicted DNA-binding transcriptional regulator YafY